MFAHEDHKKKKTDQKPDTLTIVNGDTIAINGISVEDLGAVDATGQIVEQAESLEEAGENVIYKINFNEKLFDHLHNKMVHFPIAFIYAAFLFTLIGWKENKFENSIKVLLLFGAAASIFTILTGLAQAEPFIDTPKEWLIVSHKTFGFAGAASLVIWIIFVFLKPLKKFAWVFAFITVLLFSAVAFYGGVLAH